MKNIERKGTHMEEDFISSKANIDIEGVWESATNLMSSEMTAVSFDVWIKTIKPLEMKGNCLVLATPSLSSKKVLVKNYKTIITSCLNRVHGAITSVEFVIGNGEDAQPEEKEEKPEETEDDLVRTSFNPKYTFDNFVVGSSNQFVSAAAKAVATTPGEKKFNPLFIYGGVGLGKTHLLHAIGNQVNETKPALKVVYVTCERFTNDLIDSLFNNKRGSTSDFRSKYRRADVLIIDDIQFIAKKQSVQEEFFNTFNDLLEKGKQIVVSSDKPPKEIDGLEERIRSRLEWGLMADIGVPDTETKTAILLKKAQIEHYNVSRDVIEYIAGAQSTNIRVLEGMLARTVFYSGLLGESIVTIDTAREALKDMIAHDDAELDASVILDSVCKFYNIRKEDLLARKRTKEIAYARQIAMYLISDLMTIPLAAVGDIFGKDHATVIYAKNKIAEDMSKNKKFATEINDIKAMIKGK